MTGGYGPLDRIVKNTKIPAAIKVTLIWGLGTPTGISLLSCIPQDDSKQCGGPPVLQSLLPEDDE